MPAFHTVCSTAALVIAATLPAAADAPTSFDEHTVYALSPQSSQTQLRLDIAPDKRHVRLSAPAKATGQLWHIRRSDGGTWVFGSVFTGDCKRLNVASGGTEDAVELKKKDESNAQNWTIALTSNRQFVRISSQARGPKLALSAASTPGQGGVRLVPVAPEPSAALDHHADHDRSGHRPMLLEVNPAEANAFESYRGCFSGIRPASRLGRSPSGPAESRSGAD